MKAKSGQSILEYSMLLLAVALVFVSMGAYMQRSARAKLLTTQNRVNEAFQP
jgi:uncharacterized protein (UPF0333 family)